MLRSCVCDTFGLQKDDSIKAGDDMVWGIAHV